jgi:hypothetical protein
MGGTRQKPQLGAEVPRVVVKATGGGRPLCSARAPAPVCLVLPLPAAAAAELITGASSLFSSVKDITFSHEMRGGTRRRSPRSFAEVGFASALSFAVNSFSSFFRSSSVDSCRLIDPADLAHPIPVIAFRSFWRRRV